MTPSPHPSPLWGEGWGEGVRVLVIGIYLECGACGLVLPYPYALCPMPYCDGYRSRYSPNTSLKVSEISPRVA
jgi:hypothetical protein